MVSIIPIWMELGDKALLSFIRFAIIANIAFFICKIIPVSVLNRIIPNNQLNLWPDD